MPPLKQAALRQFAKTMRSEPTPAEEALWKLLRDRRFAGHKFRRQVPIGEYIADFICFAARLIVEADGSQHGESATDPARDVWFVAQGFRVRRFWNHEILRERQSVMETLWADVSETNPSSGLRPPSPAGGEGVRWGCWGALSVKLRC